MSGKRGLSYELEFGCVGEIVKMKYYSLGNHVEILSGFAFKSEAFNTDYKGLPLIRIRNVKSASSNTYYEGNYDSRFVMQDGDILIGMDGEFNCARWKGGKSLLNQRVCRISAKSEFVDEQYLFYFLPSELRKIEDSSNFVTVKHLSVKQINEIQIPLPPIAEQKRIAAILDKADRVRRKRKEAIRLTEELLRSAFLEMFGDPVTNPKGWEKKALGNLCTIVRGGSPRPINDYLGGTIPWIKIGDATKGDEIYIHKTSEAIKAEGMKKSRYMEPGSLIFANCGVSLGFARILKIGGCIHDGWLALSDLDSSLNQIFLLKLLNSITEHFRAIAPDGTQPNLNTGIMKNFEIPIPPIDLQDKFAAITHHLTDSIQQGFDISEQTDNLFNSLLQRAFRGEL